MDALHEKQEDALRDKRGDAQREKREDALREKREDALREEAADARRENALADFREREDVLYANRVKAARRHAESKMATAPVKTEQSTNRALLHAQNRALLHAHEAMRAETAITEARVGAKKRAARAAAVAERTAERTAVEQRAVRAAAASAADRAAARAAGADSPGVATRANASTPPKLKQREMTEARARARFDERNFSSAKPSPTVKGVVAAEAAQRLRTDFANRTPL